MKQHKKEPPIRSSTQDFTEIVAVQDDIIVLKDYSACTIIASGTTNFVLLSLEEQEGMIASYASLLNSLSFPVQISIISKKMDVAVYVEYLEKKIIEQSDAKLATKLKEYKEFIQSMVKKNTILEKKFYFAIPFSPLEMGIAGTQKQSITLPYLITRAKTSLYPKRDHLLRLLQRTGIEGKILYEQEIVELFYNLYNPLAETQKQIDPIAHYHTLVISQKK